MSRVVEIKAYDKIKRIAQEKGMVPHNFFSDPEAATGLHFGKCSTPTWK